MSLNDPWATPDRSSLGSSWQQVPPAPQNQWAGYAPTGHGDPGLAFLTADGLSDTDTGTRSTDGEPDYSDPALVGMSPAQ
eukprot:1391980-Karenia_brevis.AAC.1